MNAFLTGSRAYGTPREDSDVDVVILVSPEAENVLLGLGASGNGIRFGQLNLIICTEASRFDRWAEVTSQLVSRRPVSREDAIAEFNAAGLMGEDYGEA
jgi:predicted nucleotidyltransferase